MSVFLRHLRTCKEKQHIIKAMPPWLKRIELKEIKFYIQNVKRKNNVVSWKVSSMHGEHRKVLPFSFSLLVVTSFLAIAILAS